MLTCKIGNTIINCFDDKYDKHTLKKWDEEKRLICPDCGKLYEYCHGEIVSPYFRHKEKSKECEGIYSEPETEEHIKGKMILYNWLLKLQEQGLILNVKLEAYIPETRQRPDLYFEQDNKRYVIEYQCSPIATEYIERHKLYELSGVNDIWILGRDKYRINVDIANNIEHSNHYKTIENNTFYYLNSQDSNIIIKNDIIKKCLPYKAIWLKQYYIYNIKNFTFNNKNMILNDDVIYEFIEQDKIKHGELIQKEFQNNKIIKTTLEIVKFLNTHFKDFDRSRYSFEYVDSGYVGCYICKVCFKVAFGADSYKKSTEYTFFIKENQVDCCVDYTYTKPFVGKKGGIGWERCYGYKNIDKEKYEEIDYDNLKKFIMKNVCRHIRNKKYSL